MNRLSSSFEQTVYLNFDRVFDSLNFAVTHLPRRELSFLPLVAHRGTGQNPCYACMQEFPHRYAGCDMPAATKIKAAFVSPMLRFEHFGHRIRPLSLGLACLHLFPI
jgi:hypothetical protein